MTLSEIFAKFITERKDFSHEAIILAKRSILDTYGAMILGSKTDAVKKALGTIEAKGKCSLIGSHRGLLARDAAFINGISGHELELDDTSSSNLGHPTVAVLPSLLAACEELDCSGEELIKAFLIGTEVECKIGRICARNLHEKGWHASSITGVIGAAAGVSYLLKQNAEKTRNTLGIAASMACGIRENFGTLTKSIHIGKTAEDGLRAAYLSEKGINASATALDGKEGYLYEYSSIRGDDLDIEEFSKTLGNDWDICSPGFAIKRYPSCSSTHRALDAIIEIFEEHKIQAHDVDSIQVGLSAAALRELVCPYPKTGEEAKFSIGFQAGLYLANLDNMPGNYKTEIIRQDTVAKVIAATKMYEVGEYKKLPVDMGVGPAIATVKLRDGRKFSKKRIYPVGHLTDPISDTELKNKFLKCSLEHLGENKANCLYTSLYHLEKMDSVRDVVNLSIG